jgi:hypothetical protein
MPPKSSKPPARAPRPKAEVQREFAAIEKQVEDARETADPKIAEVVRLHEKAVREAVDGVTVEAVVQRISGLGLDVSKALAGVAESLSAEVVLLASVREAVTLERKELERLHNIDTAATALDQLVRDYERRKQELEEGIAARIAEWESESERVDRERKEQEESLKKQRQRETEDFEYRKAQERKKAQDKHDEEIRLAEKRNLEKQESLEKNWALREAKLKESEEELVRLRKEASAFPVRLEAEAKSAAERARRETEARLEQEILVLKKDADTERRLGELRIHTLEDAVARDQTQIAGIEKQLADAKLQVQDIALKAIEGASGSRALSHINQIAMEQAKNRPQG